MSHTIVIGVHVGEYGAFRRQGCYVGRYIKQVRRCPSQVGIPEVCAVAFNHTRTRAHAHPHTAPFISDADTQPVASVCACCTVLLARGASHKLLVIASYVCARARAIVCIRGWFCYHGLCIRARGVVGVWCRQWMAQRGAQV